MKKRIATVFAAVFLLSLLASCAGAPQSGSGAVSGEGLQQAVPGATAGGEGAEIALFITEEQKNQGLGQAVWNTVGRFSGEEGVTYGPYTVDAADVDATLATVDLAVKSAATVLVAMGGEMADVVERAQVLYPELQFILLGVEQTPALRSNAVLLEYDELQAGWLAGYAAVLEGYRVLAYVENEPRRTEETGEPEETDDTGEAAEDEGEPDEITRQRNIGFVLGADAAALDLGLEADSVQIQTLRLEGEENATGRRQTIANLYESGVELLFAGDGAVQNDALRVARSMDAGIVGVSLHFAQDDAASVASVDKALGQPLYSLLHAWKNGQFPAERVYYSGLGQEAFTLESTGFTRFTGTQYGTLVARFASGAYAAALHSAATDEEGRYVDPLQLGTTRVLLATSEIDEDTGRFQPPAHYDQPEQEEAPEGSGGGGSTGSQPPTEPEEPEPPASSGEEEGGEEPAPDSGQEGEHPPEDDGSSSSETLGEAASDDQPEPGAGEDDDAGTQPPGEEDSGE